MKPNQEPVSLYVIVPALITAAANSVAAANGDAPWWVTGANLAIALLAALARLGVTPVAKLRDVKETISGRVKAELGRLTAQVRAGTITVDQFVERADALIDRELDRIG